MERWTHERVSGIRIGYWSPHKKEDLVQQLAAYEDSGLTPAEVRELAARSELRTEPCRPAAGEAD